MAGDLEAIKALLTVHYDTLSKDIGEIKGDIKGLQSEIFPRLNKAEQNIIKIQTDIGEHGIDSKISCHSDVKLFRSYRRGLQYVGGGVAIALICAFFYWLLFIYDTHGRAAAYEPQVTQEKK